MLLESTEVVSKSVQLVYVLGCITRATFPY